MKRVNRYFLLSTLLFICGCHKTLPELPLTEAVTAIEKQLITTQTVSVSNIDSWTPEDMTKFIINVQELQCAGKAADPIVPIFTAPITLSLSGSFHNGGSAELDVQSNSVGPKFVVASSQDKSNGLSIPVTFSALDTLPDVIFKMQEDRLDGILDKPYHNDPSITERDHLLRNRESLYQTINMVISDFDARRCISKPLTSSGVFMGTHAPH
mgnify:CR=1 FL=1